MKTSTIRILGAAALALASGLAAAQAGPGAASGPGWAASGPGGMMGRGMGPRAGRDNTYGWPMMTPEERREHQTRMRSMTSFDECKNYQAQHHQQMVERAKQRGRSVPAEPRRDACAALKR